MNDHSQDPFFSRKLFLVWTFWFIVLRLSFFVLFFFLESSTNRMSSTVGRAVFLWVVDSFDEW